MSFTLGVVTDEIDADPAVALPAAREMGLTHLEFNKVGAKGAHELSGADVAELRRMVAGEGLQVAAVDPPSFKAIELDEVPVEEVTRHAAVVEHLEQIRRACGVAGALSAASCACSRSGAATWPAPATPARWSRAAAQSPTTCCPRPSGCYARRWPSPTSAIMDDPGLTIWPPIGSGSVDYAGQADAVRRGVVSVETHRPRKAPPASNPTRETLAALRRFLWPKTPASLDADTGDQDRAADPDQWARAELAGWATRPPIPRLPVEGIGDTAG